MHRDPAEARRLTLVRRQIVDTPPDVVGDTLAHRRRVEHRDEAAPSGFLQRELEGLERRLELTENHLRPREIVRARTDVLDGKSPVRAGRDHDLVAALAVDDDESRARRGFTGDHHAVDADALGLERRPDVAARGVVADTGDEADFRAEPAGGDGPIRAPDPPTAEQGAATVRLTPAPATPRT